jgi:biotin transport system substrate-specific component
METKGKLTTRDMVLAPLFAALMAIGANITSFAPFMVIGQVPITLQTFFAVLAGVILGSRLGSISMLLYMLIGLFGAPVFAKFGGGFSSILSPTFGFIVSFIFAAFVAGKIVEAKPTFGRFIVAAIVGTAVNYLVGTNWMYLAFKHWAEAPEGFTYTMAWGWMVLFIPKDLTLAIFAGILAHRLRKIPTINANKKIA